MNNELIERYIYAVTKGMDSRTGADVADELRANIEDMLEARCGEVVPTEQDVRVVLTELGTPLELRTKYSTDSVGHLIGGSYYVQYKSVLKIVFIAVGISIIATSLLDAITEAMPWYEVIASVISSFCAAMMSAYAIVTFIFAVLERKGTRIGDVSIDDLPAIPSKRMTIKRSDCIADIILTVIGTALVLLFPGVFCILHLSQSSAVNINLLNEPLFRSSAAFIIGGAAISIVNSCVKMAVGVWNKRTLAVSIAAAVITVVLAACWLPGAQLISQESSAWMLANSGEDAAELTKLIDNSGWLLFGIIAFANIVGCAVNIYRTAVSKEA